MQKSKKPMPLPTINGIRNRVNTEPDFQRPPVWATSQKQLLIDTILRNCDVPKLYWRRTGTRPDKYDVVDGQQRLRCKFAPNNDPARQWHQAPDMLMEESPGPGVAIGSEAKAP